MWKEQMKSIARHPHLLLTALRIDDERKNSKQMMPMLNNEDILNDVCHNIQKPDTLTVTHVPIAPMGND
jgi:hypothetical protein